MNPANISTLDQAGMIIWAKLRMARHQVASVRGESKLKVAVISVSAIGLWVGAFLLFFYGFRFLMLIGNDKSGEFNFGDLLMGRMRNPSLSLHGIEGAFSDPGAKTVIPAKVSGKFSIRYVKITKIASRFLVRGIDS